MVFLVGVRSNLAKETHSHTSIHWWGEQLKRIPFLGLEYWLIICNNKKVIKNNFLNLLCALSCVILSADCSAIVFLYVNFNVAFYLISIFNTGCMSSSQNFFGCIIMKKVEEHCIRAASLAMLSSPSEQRVRRRSSTFVDVVAKFKWLVVSKKFRRRHPPNPNLRCA